MIYKKLLISLFLILQSFDMAATFSSKYKKIAICFLGSSVVYTGLTKSAEYRLSEHKLIPEDQSKKYKDWFKTFCPTEQDLSVDFLWDNRTIAAYLSIPWLENPTFFLSWSLLGEDEKLQYAFFAHEAGHYKDRWIEFFYTIGISTSFFYFLSRIHLAFAIHLLKIVSNQYFELRADNYACRFINKEEGDMLARRLEDNEKENLLCLKNKYPQLTENQFCLWVVRQWYVQSHPCGYLRAKRIRERMNKKFPEIKHKE